jgi:VanZ family protein
MNNNRIKPDISTLGSIPEEGVLRFKNIWRLIAYLIVLTIIVLSLIPDPEKITPFHASDKIMHALVYAFAMLWFGFCFKGKKLFTSAAVLVLLGIVLEIIQGQTGYRTMDFYDGVADCVGVFIGLMLSFSRLSNALQYIEQRFLK